VSDSLEPLPPSAIEPVNRLLADLEAAQTVPEVRLIFDRAEALYDAAKRARVAEDQLRLYAAISLKAQRRGGELLKQTPRAKGRPWHGLPTISELLDLPPEKARHVADNWLAIAEVPEPLFEEYVTKPGLPSRAGLLRFGLRIPKRAAGRPLGQPRQNPQLRGVPDPRHWENDAKAKGWQECVEWFAQQTGSWRVVDACLQAGEAANPYTE
jgi:hypothetical protein